MKAYIEGTLRIVENGEFTDKDTGKVIPRWINYIQDEEGMLEKISSKDVDHSAFIGRDCVFTIALKPDFNKPNLFRATLTDVKPV